MPEPTKKQKKYVAIRGTGVSRDKSAVMAGYSESQGQGHVVERSETVRAALVEEARKYAKVSDVSRKDVIDAFRDAADMARLLGEPMGMVAAWREIAKVCGHFAPEVKKIELSSNNANLRGALELMTDEELLQITQGKVYEGEYKEITDETGGDDADT